MRTTIQRFANVALLSAALLIPVAVAPTALRADDKIYHDKERNEDHKWDSHEDKAYRIWVKENHRKYKDFAKLNEEDQRSYWAWRHDHNDALLKIDIH